MFVKAVAGEVFEVLFSQLLGVHLADFVGEDVPVLVDVVLLVEFLTERYDVLLRHVGVGVEL